MDKKVVNKKKIRIDENLVESGIADNLKHAQALILAGQVIVNDQRVDKAGCLIHIGAVIRLKNEKRFVSRGGLKLQGGLDKFKLNPTGLVCLDIGASSGGFTDCLLQSGAKKIYAVDVAYGQIDWKIRSNPKVIVIERFNAKNISKTQIPEAIHLAVIDVSFISLTKLIIPMVRLFQDKSAVSIIALIKPQFELPKHQIGTNGVVQTDELRQLAIDHVFDFLKSNDLSPSEVVQSPIKGPKGNVEYLVHITCTL